MKIDFKTLHCTVSPNITSLATKRIDKLAHFYSKIISVLVSFKAENITEKDNKSTSLKIAVPGEDIMVKKKGKSFEEALDSAANTAERLLKRKKQKEIQANSLHVK